eukprot:c12594_g1_i1 orf=752-967(+)
MVIFLCQSKNVIDKHENSESPALQQSSRAEMVCILKTRKRYAFKAQKHHTQPLLMSGPFATSFKCVHHLLK